ncbi:MAG: Hsp20/alpha crystallin family protein [Acidobacteriota bacterium]
MKRKSADDPAEDERAKAEEPRIVHDAVDNILGGLGKITARLGEVAELAGDAINEAQRRQQDGGSQQDGDGEERRNVVYDVSMRVGLGDALERSSMSGKPSPDISRHRVKATSRRASPAADSSRTKPSNGTVREPYAETTIEDDRAVIVLDMPGVEASDVVVRAARGRLEVAAQGAGRSWQKSLEVPGLTEEHEIYVTAKNGIVRLESRPASGEPDADRRDVDSSASRVDS